MLELKRHSSPFSRLQKADPILGVDMVSTGEVGCIGDDYYEAILTAMLSVGYTIPKKNILLSTGPAHSKAELIGSARMLTDLGFELYATRGTHNFFAQNNIPTTMVYWPDEQEKPNVLDLFREHKIELVINIPKDLSKPSWITIIPFGVALLILTFHSSPTPV